MRTAILSLMLLAVAGTGAPVQARAPADAGEPTAAVLQCVPYARQLTGVRIYGDAYTWWNQAAGRYERGRTPRPGAVMAVRPYGNSRLGHVAAVERVLDSRTLLISHANWSSPGEIERNVKAVDVSPYNDWSEVRIWYGPNEALGSRHWPLYGFIYGDRTVGSSKQPTSTTTDLIADIITGQFG